MGSRRCSHARLPAEQRPRRPAARPRRWPRSPERPLLSSRGPWRAIGTICSSPARPPARGEAEPAEAAEKRRGVFRRLRENLSKTRQALGGEIQATLWGTLDEHTWERLEEALIMADVGASTTASVVATLEAEASEGSLDRRRGVERAADRAAGRDRARGRRSHRPPQEPDGDHGGRRERYGQDDDDRQARLAPATRARADACCWAPRTRSGPRRASSWKAGRSGRAVRS